METIHLSEKTYHGALFEAVKVIRAGGVLVYPTDTVYGIGGNALDTQVIERVFEIKRRPQEKAMIILVRDIATARRYGYIDLWTESVLSRLWPGPVSVILHRKDALPEAAAGGKNTIALRVPDSPFLQDILKQVDCPLIATSANLSGSGTAPKILGQFLQALRMQEKRPDLVIDAGPIGSRPSTLLDLTNKKNPMILRRGALSDEELASLLQPHEKVAA